MFEYSVPDDLPGVLAAEADRALSMYKRVADVVGVENPPKLVISQKTCLFTPTPWCGFYYHKNVGERVELCLPEKIDRSLFTCPAQYSDYLTANNASLFIMAHELQHAKQAAEGRLRKDPVSRATIWEGAPQMESMFLSQERYYELPWEKEANSVAFDAVLKITLKKLKGTF